MTHSESLDKIAPALMKAQPKIERAVKNSENPFHHNRYTDLNSVWDACREPLHSNGIVVIQAPCTTADGTRSALRTILLHESGQWIAGELLLPEGLKGAQEIGSAITYFRRYSLAAMAGVCPEDDDGEGAMGRQAPAQSPRFTNRRDASPGPGRGVDGAAGNGHTNPPRSGKALFAWTRDMEQRLDVKLLGFLNAFGKGQGWPPKMTEWGPAEVSRAHAEAMRHLREERSPDELGDEPDAGQRG